VAGVESSMEQNQGTKVPWNFSPRERKFQGTKVPPYGTFVPGDESSWGRKFLISGLTPKLTVQISVWSQPKGSATVSAKK